MTYSLKKIIFIFLLFNISSIYAANIPFKLGEVLNYKASFRGVITSNVWIDIANIKLTIAPEMKKIEGQSAYLFQLDLTTENFKKAEVIYSVRYHINSYVNEKLNKTLFYEETTQTRKFKHKVIWFDWKNKIGELFRNRKKTKIKKNFFQREYVWVKPEKDNVPVQLLKRFTDVSPGVPYLKNANDGKIALPDEVYDRLSAVQAFRKLQLKPGEKVVVPVFSGKAVNYNQVSTEGEEVLMINNKPVKTIKLKIATSHLSGVFKKSKNASLSIWLTADKRKIPVRIHAKVKYGIFGAELLNLNH
jgi:hypothetical protein